MEAGATLRGARISGSFVVTFIVALLAAFLLGGAGGYLVRGVTIPTPTATSPAVPESALQPTPTPHPSGAQPLPAQTPPPQPGRDFAAPGRQSLQHSSSIERAGR